MQQESRDAVLERTHAKGAVPPPLSRSREDHPIQSARSPPGKQKKRSRSECASDPVKQQRIDKHPCSDATNASEAPEAVVGKNGGLCSVGSVDRLVRMMVTYEWHDRVQRLVDLMANRTVLAKIIAATVDRDCLSRFLKLGGLIALDRWLQELSMGRNSPERQGSPEWDRVSEDLLLAILGALERLPVDVVALRTCRVVKSVSHVCGHKHHDIQRRARNLIEAWKKRIESEMQTGKPSLSMKQTAYLEGGSGGSNSHEGCQLESRAPFEHSDAGRGKYISVSSLGSPPERQSRASSAITAAACSADNSGKSSPKGSGDADVIVAAPSPHLSNVFPQAVQDCRAGSTCVTGCYTDQRRVIRTTGANTPGKSTTLNRHGKSVVNNAAVDVSIMSGSVWDSKDLTEQPGSILINSSQMANPFSVPESCTLPKGSENTAACNFPCGSTVNSASSCAPELKERELHHSKQRERQLCFEPAKKNSQRLASLALSANSTVDVKSPDSPSVRSMCSPSPTAIAMDNKVVTASMGANYSHQFSLVGNIPAERDHYDRNSSTVSSPSETSIMLMDSGFCENKGGNSGYGNIHSPGGTVSEMSLSSALGSKISARKLRTSAIGAHQDHINFPLLCEKGGLALPLNSVGEAVGESKGDSLKMGSPFVKPALNSMALRKASEGTVEPSRCGEDGPLDTNRMLPANAEQQAVTCKHASHKAVSLDKGGAPCVELDAGSRGTDALMVIGSKQSYSGSVSPSLNMKGNERVSTLMCSADVSKTLAEQKQVANQTATFERKPNRRPDFDLNEMLGGGEEGVVQALGRASNVALPAIDNTHALPALDNRHAPPVMPMAPVAKLAATKGPLILQAIASDRPPMGALGWKGSAATSAFRPAQPRTSFQKSPLDVAEHSMHGKIALDFDLNMAAVESSSFVCDEVGNADMGVRLSSMDLKGAAGEVEGGGARSYMSKKADATLRTTWDLNQSDIEAADSRSKLDLDLNKGPAVQDCDDVVLAAKPVRLKDPLPSSSLAAFSRLPNHSLRPSAPPMAVPAFALSNPEMPYAAGNARPWMNGGPHDGSSQYVFMQNPSGFASSGMVCPPLPSVAAGPFQGVAYGFSPAPLQCFASYGDLHGTSPQSVAVFPVMASSEPLLPSQSKPPFVMSMLREAVHQQVTEGFWNRANLDLNAGP